jgi:peptidoglycan hydrolase CwlO-like protein
VLVAAALAGLTVLAAAAFATVAPDTLRATSAQLLSAQAQAEQLAAQIADLDAGISGAAARCERAGDRLSETRAAIRRTRRLQAAGREDLTASRAALAQRAVALYKQDDISTLAAILSADDFVAMVGHLSQVHAVVRADEAILLKVERVQRRLQRRAAALAADERAARRLVRRRDRELSSIKAQMDERQALLDNTRADIRRLVAAQAPPAPAPAAPTASTSGDASTGDDSGGDQSSSGGSGAWWPLIEQAAAVNGVSARGMYRLMMIESGGNASVVGPGGYFGLFQYAPSTWKGSWNPYRGQSITNGAAQIKATALALRLGYGHAWWDPSYSNAFGGG